MDFIYAETPLRQALLSFSNYRSAAPTSKSEALHYALVRMSYVAFYVAIAFMALSGLTMVYEDQLHLPEAFTSNLHQVHELFQWYFLIFVISHIGGVVVAELGKYKGIVSAMIHGGERGPKSPHP